MEKGRRTHKKRATTFFGQLFLDNVVLIFCSSFWPSIRVKEVVEMVVVDVVVVVVVDDGDIPRASTLLLLLSS